MPDPGDKTVQEIAQELMEAELQKRQVTANTTALEEMRSGHAELAGLVADQAATIAFLKTENERLRTQVNKSFELTRDRVLPHLKSMDTDIGHTKVQVAGCVTDVSAAKKAIYGVPGDDDKRGLIVSVSDIKKAVGNDDSGLTKDVAEVKSAIGDRNHGITKAVAELEKQSIKKIATIGGGAGLGSFGVMEGLLYVLKFLGG
jgi:hypothetical protein